MIFVGGLALYTATLNGDVQAADSGEFQIAAITLGIPHPPGYPLFTMLGWLFSQVPIGSPFARVSFLSVVASSLTLVLVSATVLLMGQMSNTRLPAHPLTRVLAALTAALALATSTTFWAQATTTNIRSLTAFFTALMVFASVRAWATRKPSSLVLFALACGLGVAHHVSLIFIGVVLGVFVLIVLWRANSRTIWRWLVWAALTLIATQLIWLYLPLRDAAGARFAPGNLTTLDGLLFHIFARGFVGDMLAFATPEFLFDRLALLPTLLEFQFGLPLLLLMALAAIALVVRTRSLGIALLIAFGLHLFITITYRAPQTVEYALPCWVIACVALGGGLTSLRMQGTRRITLVLRLVPWVLALVAFFLATRDGLTRLPSYVALAQDRTVRQRAEGVLRYAQPNSTILAQWHQATPMWALQDVEGMQRGVKVEYVYPRGARPYAESFAARAKESADKTLTYVTSLYERELQAQGLRSFPLSNTPAWRVASQFNFQTSTFPNTTFDERIVISGPLGLNDAVVETGQSLQIDLWWYRKLARKDGDSITVRVLRPDGRLAANADVRLAPDDALLSYSFKRVALGIPLDLLPGRYDIFVGAYRNASSIEQFKSAKGNDFERAATINVEASTQPPATQRQLDVANDTAEPQLIGVDYDTGIVGPVRVWTHWRLGTTAREITLIGADDKPLAAPQHLAANVSLSPARYVSLPFDIPPVRDVRIGFSGQRLPAFTDGERYVPFGNQMVLIATSAQHNGTSLKADLTWLSVRPIVDDYIVSVRVEGGGMYKTHDSVPALGAIPTLKWIRGSRVLDRHPFDLGDYRESLRGTVVVYDSVSQLPLPPLDERYGDGVTIPIN